MSNLSQKTKAELFELLQQKDDAITIAYNDLENKDKQLQEALNQARTLEKHIKSMEEQTERYIASRIQAVQVELEKMKQRALSAEQGLLSFHSLVTQLHHLKNEQDKSIDTLVGVVVKEYIDIEEK